MVGGGRGGGRGVREKKLQTRLKRSASLTVSLFVFKSFFL